MRRVQENGISSCFVGPRGEQWSGLICKQVNFAVEDSNVKRQETNHKSYNKFMGFPLWPLIICWLPQLAFKSRKLWERLIQTNVNWCKCELCTTLNSPFWLASCSVSFMTQPIMSVEHQCRYSHDLKQTEINVRFFQMFGVWRAERSSIWALPLKFLWIQGQSGEMSYCSSSAVVENV